MKPERILQAILFGELLSNPEKLKTTDLNQFSREFRPLVESLSVDPFDRSRLQTWLKEAGVEWKEGRALDAVKSVAVVQSDQERLDSVRQRAKLLIAKDKDSLRVQLQAMVDELS